MKKIATEFEYRDSIRKKYPVGTFVFAPIYGLRDKIGYEPKWVKVIGHTSEEKCKEGYRFGVHVEYDNKPHWVLPQDIKTTL